MSMPTITSSKQEKATVSSINIRNLEPAVKAKLRVRAASRGRSMEEEARSILRSALAVKGDESDLGLRIRKRFAALGGVELSVPAREPIREPPALALRKK